MSRNRGEFNEINITPLTDIFLVLLIIMMVIAPLLDQQGLNLTVPENVAEEQVKQDTKILTVNVTADNKYYIGGEEIPVNELEKLHQTECFKLSGRNDDRSRRRVNPWCCCKTYGQCEKLRHNKYFCFSSVIVEKLRINKRRN